MTAGWRRRSSACQRLRGERCQKWNYGQRDNKLSQKGAYHVVPEMSKETVYTKRCSESELEIDKTQFPLSRVDQPNLGYGSRFCSSCWGYNHLYFSCSGEDGSALPQELGGRTSGLRRDMSMSAFGGSFLNPHFNLFPQFLVLQEFCGSPVCMGLPRLWTI